MVNKRKLRLNLCLMITYLSSNGTTKLADQSELVLFCVPLHDGTSGPHLCHDTACSPQVNRWTIVSLP